jgi:hypothetical protein
MEQLYQAPVCGGILLWSQELRLVLQSVGFPVAEWLAGCEIAAY